jgi:hypothetical protein
VSAKTQARIWLAILAIISVVVSDIGLAQQKAGCERRAISMRMSPDYVWVAVVHENVCSDGYFVTTLTYVVQLLRRESLDSIRLIPYSDKPQNDNDVLAGEMSHENPPELRWVSASKLQITVPNRSLIGLQKRSSDGVEVVLKFDPDDPSDRERWLKERGFLAK